MQQLVRRQPNSLPARSYLKHTVYAPGKNSSVRWAMHGDLYAFFLEGSGLTPTSSPPVYITVFREHKRIFIHTKPVPGWLGEEFKVALQHKDHGEAKMPFGLMLWGSPEKLGLRHTAQPCELLQADYGEVGGARYISARIPDHYWLPQKQSLPCRQRVRPVLIKSPHWRQKKVLRALARYFTWRPRRLQT